MAATVGQVLEFLNTIAPMNTAESYDNVGLLTGNSAENITGIACCLDITQEIIDEALSKNANLIVSHHPVIFHPLKRVMAGTPVYSLVRSDISAIAVHTNFDMCEAGVNDALMELLASHRLATLPSRAFPEIPVFTTDAECEPCSYV